MSDVVRVFVDYQNTYRAARDIYHDGFGPHMLGQVNPGPLGQLLVDRSDFDRKLTEVRVYRGLPSSKYDPKGYGAARAQLATWERDPLVSVVTRPLRYPSEYPDSPAEEKGIDVALAVDFVMGAARGAFDVGIVISLDTDLRPAIETVMNDLHGVRAEVAAFNNPDRHCRRLSVPGSKVWCHWIQPHDYEIITTITTTRQVLDLDELCLPVARHAVTVIGFVGRVQPFRVLDRPILG